jgi:hypothetical protein
MGEVCVCVRFAVCRRLRFGATNAKPSLNSTKKVYNSPVLCFDRCEVMQLTVVVCVRVVHVAAASHTATHGYYLIDLEWLSAWQAYADKPDAPRPVRTAPPRPAPPHTTPHHLPPSRSSVCVPHLTCLAFAFAFALAPNAGSHPQP